MLATDPAGILVELQARGVRFTVTGDRLKWTPKAAITADELDLLRRHKPDLIRLLRHADDQPAESDQSAVSTTTGPPHEPWGDWLCRSLTERTGRTWYSTTPLALADDDHPGRNPR
jgi:hypothetical protein